MPYYVYLMTDTEGCSPVVTMRPLPWRLLRKLPGFLVRPRGSYVRLDHALEECEEIVAVEDELAAERRAGLS